MIPDLLKKKKKDLSAQISVSCMIIHTSQLISDFKMTTQIKVNFHIMFIPLVKI